MHSTKKNHNYLEKNFYLVLVCISILKKSDRQKKKNRITNPLYADAQDVQRIHKMLLFKINYILVSSI